MSDIHMHDRSQGTAYLHGHVHENQKAVVNRLARAIGHLEKVKRMVEIKLPRPRSSEVVSSEAFGRYVAQIWGDLREEASRGLEDEEGRKLREGEKR